MKKVLIAYIFLLVTFFSCSKQKINQDRCSNLNCYIVNGFATENQILITDTLFFPDSSISVRQKVIKLDSKDTCPYSKYRIHIKYDLDEVNKQGLYNKTNFINKINKIKVYTLNKYNDILANELVNNIIIANNKTIEEYNSNKDTVIIYNLSINLTPDTIYNCSFKIKMEDINGNIFEAITEPVYIKPN